MPPKIFLSHSKHCAVGAQSVEVLRAALTAAGYQPLVDDQDVRLGDAWRRKLRLMMAEATAGVVLLSPSAARSAWVLAETAVLSFRAEVDSSFRFIPVLLPGVGREELTSARFAPMALDELQVVESPDYDAVARKIIEVLPPAARAAQSMLEQLATEFRHRMSRWTDAQVGTTLERLAIQSSGRGREGDREDLARHVARVALSDGVSPFIAYARGLRGVLSSEEFRTAFGVAYPLWIPSEIAGRIETASKKVPPPPVALISDKTCLGFTCERHLQRAWWPENLPLLYLLTAVDGESPLRDLLSELRAGVRARLRRQDVADDEVDAYLRDREDLVIALPAIPAAVLEALRAQFPRATVILLFHEQPDERWDPTTSLEVLPPLETVEVQAARKAEWAIQDYLSRYDS